MQPEAPYPTPQPSAPPPQPQPTPTNPLGPDYSFLNQPAKPARRLPFAGNSLVGRIIVILVCLVLLVILVIIVKDIITPSAFNKSDYTVVVERQQEMLHILSVDVTESTATQLSAADQNFASTATLALQTAQDKTLTFMDDYKDKTNTAKLATVYDSAIDQEFSSALQTNTFDSVFQAQMSKQLASYEQELKAAYASTSSLSGKSLLKSEYAEAKKLATALGSSTS